MPAWISCAVPADAPFNDLNLYKAMKQYAEINDSVAAAGLNKLKLHLWYLVLEMVPLSLFSSKVDNEGKKNIAQAMALNGNDWAVRTERYSVEELGNWTPKIFMI